MPTKNPPKDTREENWPPGLYIRQNSYRYRRMHKRHQVIEVWGSMPIAEALRRARQFNLDLENGKDPIKQHKAQKMSFREFAYNTWLPLKSKLCESSQAKYRSVVDNFDHYLTQHCRRTSCLLSDIDYPLAQDFIAFRQRAPVIHNETRRFTRTMKSGASKKTIHGFKTILCQLFNEAVKREYLKINPFKEVQAPNTKPDEVRAAHHPLSLAEEEALIETAGIVDKERGKKGNALFQDLVVFMLNTGMRLDEVCMLTWDDIDSVIHIRDKKGTETRRVPIPASCLGELQRLVHNKKPNVPLFEDLSSLNTSSFRLPIRNKSDLKQLKVRDIDFATQTITFSKDFAWKPKASCGSVPINTVVKELLARLRQKSPAGNFVFQHHDGGRCRLRILDMLKQAQKKAEIPGRLRVHDLRHTFAVKLREMGVPLATIQGLLRHADMKETLIYAPYGINEGRKAVEKLAAAKEDPTTPGR